MTGIKTRKQKIRENMKIPPAEKLKRLKRIMGFTEHFSTRRVKKIRKALVER